jgi:hypothetical protein
MGPFQLYYGKALFCEQFMTAICRTKSVLMLDCSPHESLASMHMREIQCDWAKSQHHPNQHRVERVDHVTKGFLVVKRLFLMSVLCA